MALLTAFLPFDPVACLQASGPMASGVYLAGKLNTFLRTSLGFRSCFAHGILACKVAAVIAALQSLCEHANATVYLLQTHWHLHHGTNLMQDNLRDNLQLTGADGCMVPAGC